MSGVRDMTCRTSCALLLVFVCAVVAFATPAKRNKDSSAARLKEIRHDPAYRAGFDDGYRQGANDSAALSNSYKDEMGPLYDEASDAYTTQYGDRAAYQKLFRQGYVAGYKEGWDFNAGQYCPQGCGGGGP